MRPSDDVGVNASHMPVTFEASGAPAGEDVRDLNDSDRNTTLQAICPTTGEKFQDFNPYGDATLWQVGIPR